MINEMDEMTEFAPVEDKTRKIAEKIIAGEKWVKQGHYSKTDARWKQWERNAKYLRCIWDDSWANGVCDSTFNVNTIYSHYHVKKPTLYFKNPKISAKPTKPDFTRDEFGNVVTDEKGRPVLVDNYKAAKLLSVKINYELREIGYKHTLKKTISDNLCPYGIGWRKWGYSTMTAAGHSNQRDTKVSFWCKRIDPRNIVYDPMATSMEDCRWIAERLILTRKECRDLGFNIPKDYVASLPDFLKERKKASKSGGDGSDDDLVIVWEFHDLVENEIRWPLLEGKNGESSSEVREAVSEPYPFEGSCYVPTILDPDGDDIIGLSDVEPIEEQALALNRLRTMEVKHMENFGTTIFREEGAVDANEMAKYKRTPFGGEVVLKDGGLNRFQVQSTPSMGNDHYQFTNVIKDEMRTTLAITDYQQGGDVSRTATEGSIIQNAANNRIEEQRSVIYDSIIEDVRRLAAMIQAFSAEEDYINLDSEDLSEDYIEVFKQDYGYNPKIPFLRMSKQDIQGEFNFEFQIDDMIIRPKEVQLQQWTNLLGVIGSNPLLMAAAQEEDISMGKVLNKIFELSGADIEEVKAGGPAQLSVEQENQMFLNGLEVPEPHRKDHDDEHIVGHTRVANQLEQQLQQGQAQLQQIGQEIQMLNQGADVMVQDANQAALVQQRAQELQMQLQALTEQLMPLEQMVRRVKLHIQEHDKKQMKKANIQGMGGAGGKVMGGAPAPQPAVNRQVAIQSQAQQI